jgi:hypothetical protein
MKWKIIKLHIIIKSVAINGNRYKRTHKNLNIYGKIEWEKRLP